MSESLEFSDIHTSSFAILIMMAERAQSARCANEANNECSE
jgi:hypothetical protein